MKYRSDIDGLRSLAVLPVVFFHAGLTIFSGGFVGVDVFFVISGFLITAILRSDLDEGRYSLLAFYERRIRRILPALLSVIAVTWIFCWYIFLPTDFIDFSKSLVSVSGFISNLYFWKNSGYFDSSAQLRPLLHTWSLGVEEQFYIFMPLAMFAAHKYFKKLWVPLFAVIAMASFVLSIFCTTVAPTANFFMLPTRAWELLLGALLTLSDSRGLPKKWMGDILALAGFGLIATPVFLYSEGTPFPGLMALAPCAGAAFLLYSGQDPNGVASRVLSWRPLVWVGQISYSLYLIHWPVTVFFRYLTLSNPTFTDAVLIVVTSVVLAALSWHYIERPFRNHAFLASRPAILWGAVALLAVIALIGVGGVTSKGFPDRFPTFKAVHVVRQPGDGWNEGKCFFQDFSYERWRPENCDVTHHGNENVLLWGDSYAAHYSPGLSQLSKFLPVHVFEYTAAGCPPVLSYYSYARVKCTAFNQNALKIIDSLHIKKVILSARWVDLQHHGLGGLGDTIKILRAKGLDVYVIGQSPVFVTDVNLIAFRKSDGSQDVDYWRDGIQDDLNHRVQAEVSRLNDSHVHFIDPRALLCNDSLCPYRQGKMLLYEDNGHFSRLGSILAVQRYFPLFNDLSGDRTSTIEK